MPSPRIAQKVGLLPSPTFIPGRRERETPESSRSRHDAEHGTLRGQCDRHDPSPRRMIDAADVPTEMGRYDARAQQSQSVDLTDSFDRASSPTALRASNVSRYSDARHAHAHAHTHTHTQAEAYALAHGDPSRRASRVSGPAQLPSTSGAGPSGGRHGLPMTMTMSTGRDHIRPLFSGSDVPSIREQSAKGKRRVVERLKAGEGQKEKEREKERDKENGHLHGGTLVSKPIFEWITRKLGGAGRRATITGLPEGGGAAVANGDFNAIAGPSTGGRYEEQPATERARRTHLAVPMNEEESRSSRDGDYGFGISPTNPVPIHQPRSGHLHGLPAPYRTAISPATPPRTRIGPTPHPARPQLSPAQIFPPVRDRMSVVSRSETLSLRSYRLASPSERERRREANNPYPSIPMPLLHRGSIMSTTTDAPSMSFLSRSISREGSVSMRSVRSGRSGRSGISGGSFSVRSGRSIRTSSVRSVDVGRRSIASSLRPRLSILERRRREGAPMRHGSSFRDGSFYANRESFSRSRSRGLSQTLGGPIHAPSITDHPLSLHTHTDEPLLEGDGPSGRFTPAFADEDASIRPFPPSHPGSPTPSISVISRTSRSASEVLINRAASTHIADESSLNQVSDPSSSVEATPHPDHVDDRQGDKMPNMAQLPDEGYSLSQRPVRDEALPRSPSGSSGLTSGSGRSRQGSTSTRPTTVRSFDSGPGVAHIAQAAVTNQQPVAPQAPAAAPVPIAAHHMTAVHGDHIESPSSARALGVPTNTALPAYFHPVSPLHGHHGHTAIAVSSPLRETVSQGSSGATSPVSPASPRSDRAGSPSSLAAIAPTSPARVDESAAPTPLASLSPARSAFEVDKDAIVSPIGSAGHGSAVDAAGAAQPNAGNVPNTHEGLSGGLPSTPQHADGANVVQARSGQRHSVQAPRHTPHHPIFNPHPSAPPAPNASTLTLASSTFAQGPARPTSASRLSLLSNGPSMHGSLIPHRASLPGQSITWAEEGDEARTGQHESADEGGHAPGHGAAGMRRSSEPLSRSPRLGEIDDAEEEGQRDASESRTGTAKTPRSAATPLLAAPLPAAGQPGEMHRPIIHRPPSIAPSTYSYHSSEPYQYQYQAHSYTRPASIFGAATGASYKTSHTGWTGASASASAWALRFGPGVGAGADEGASIRALRRRGSAGSMESFESRWSWAPARGVGVVQGRGDGVSA